MADEETEEHVLAWSGAFGESGPQGGGVMTFENGDTFEGIYEGGKRAGTTRSRLHAIRRGLTSRPGSAGGTGGTRAGG